jgi:hypothetical protein
MQSNFEYDVFLCHTGIDKPWVEQLGAKIELEEFGNRKLRVFLDEWDIKPSENIPSKINHALDHCRYMIITLSPEMVVAPWPNAEWQSFYMNDPGGRRGTMIPILYRTCEIPPLLRPICRLDFRDSKKFNQEYRKLIPVLKNESLQRGFSSVTREIVKMVHELDTNEPDKTPEKITSNIYPIISYPKFIWSAKTQHTSYKTAIEKLKEVTSVKPAFILKENKLFSFSDLSNNDNLLQRIIDLDDIKKEFVKNWREDEIKSRWFMELLNRCLFLYCTKKGLWFDNKHKRFFFPPFKNGTGELLIEWTPTKRRTRRFLVSAVKNPNNVVVYWRHQAARINFVRIGGNLFLQILPGYTFTKNGRDPVDRKRAGRLSTRWMHDEYNSRFLYHLAFWVVFFRTSNFETITYDSGMTHLHAIDQKNIIAIRTGSANINISTIPMNSDINVGIESDNHPLEKLLDDITDELPSIEESEMEEILMNLDSVEDEEDEDETKQE